VRLAWSADDRPENRHSLGTIPKRSLEVPDTPTAMDSASLRRDLDGQAILPGDESWDEARRAWNLAVDLQPAAVVQAAGADDVVRVVDLARERGLRVAAQSTGHGAEPWAHSPTRSC
jgi:hypothetical protein